jgi:hypothetical protein
MKPYRDQNARPAASKASKWEGIILSNRQFVHEQLSSLVHQIEELDSRLARISATQYGGLLLHLSQTTAWVEGLLWGLRSFDERERG